MRTDKERLDLLEKYASEYGYGWLCRYSDIGRGIRLHETTREGAVASIREAIDNFLDIVQQLDKINS